MRRDEFNHVTINNESQLRGGEFSGAKISELFSQPENRAPVADLNAGVREEINAVENGETGSKRGREVYNSDSEKYFEEGTKGASVSGGSSASTGAGAASGAGSAVAATASTAATAGAVVVTAFAVVTAAPVILSNAKVDLESMAVEASSHEIFYSFELLDTLEDELYVVTLSNETYEETHELVPGSNYGEFSDLSSDQEFDFVIVEGKNVELQRELFRAKYKTDIEEIIPDATATLNSYEVGETTFSYVVTIENFNYQYTYIASVENATMSLEQELSLDYSSGTFDELSVNETYTFYLREKTSNGDERVLISQEFTTVAAPKVEFNGLIFDKTANFVERYFELQLDYVDELDALTDFEFTLTDVGLAEEGLVHTYQLSKTTEVQRLYFDGQDIDFYYGLKDEYQYAFSYKNDGKTVSETSESFYFTDTSGAKMEFYGINISPDSVDYSNQTLTLQMSYEDPLNEIWESQLFISRLDPTGAEVYTSSRYIVMMESQDVDFGFEYDGAFLSPSTLYSYYVQYQTDEGIFTTDTESFTTNGVSSVFNGVSIEQFADCENGVVTLALDYQDEESIMSNFVLHIYSSNPEEEITANLGQTTSPQNVTLVSDEQFLISGTTYTYYVMYSLYAETITTQSQTVLIYDNSDKPEFDSISFDDIDYSNKRITVTLNYNDGTGYYESGNFILRLTNSSDSTLTHDYILESNTGRQFISATFMDGADEKTFDLEHYTYNYSLIFNDGEQNIVLEESDKPMAFTDQSASSSFNELTFVTDMNENLLYDSGDFSIQGTLDYEDYFDYFPSALTLTVSKDDYSYTYNVSKTKALQTLTFNMPDEGGSTSGDFKPQFAVDPVDWSYSLSYVDPITNETVTTAISGLVYFMENSTEGLAQIDSVEWGAVMVKDGAYHVPFRFSRIMATTSIEPSITIGIYNMDLNEEKYLNFAYFTETGSCYFDDSWQGGSFENGVFESLDDFTNFTDGLLLCRVYANDEMVLEQEMSFDMNDDYEEFRFLGVRIRGYSSSSNAIQFTNVFYNGPAPDSYRFILIVDDVEYELSGNLPTFYLETGTLSISNTVAAGALMDGQPVSLVFAYGDATAGEERISIVDNYVFPII